MSPLAELLEDYLEHLAVERGLSVNTLDAYRRDLSALREHLDAPAEREPRSIQPPDLLGWLASLSRGGVSARTQARKQVAMRGWFRWLREEGAIEADPAQGLRMPKAAKKLPELLSRAEVVDRKSVV